MNDLIPRVQMSPVMRMSASIKMPRHLQRVYGPDFSFN
jgi:hypothetical protein